MNKSEKALNELKKGIQTYVNRMLELAPFDKTMVGIVKTAYDNNLYTVTVNQQDYNNVPCLFKGLINVGDVVKVKIPQNNNNLMYIEGKLNSEILPSYIGMLDVSTVNNTLEKVQTKYGADTNWIQHSGYVLRGATSGVVAKSATKTGGNDNAVVVSHAHTASSSASSSASTSVSVSNAGIAHGNYNLAIPWVAWLGQSGCANGLDKYVIASDGSNKAIQLADGAGHAHGASASTSVSTSVSTTVNANGEDGTNKNMMNYKSVYIWERIA